MIQIRYTFQIELNDSWLDCPLCWRNFVESLPNDAPKDIGGITTKYINKKLKKYYAEYIEDPYRPFLNFADEESATVFVLKFS